MFRKLVNRLLASTDPEVIDNITSIFDDFLSKCGDVSNSKDLFNDIFFHAETLETLFKVIISSN